MSFIDPTTPNPWATSGIDPDVLDPDTALEYESELVIGRRSFSTAQSFFSQFGRVTETFTAVSAHWHGTTIDPNEGSFALVQTGSRIDHWVGEIVRVWVGSRSVYAYVVGETTYISQELSLARRAFMAVGPLAQTPKGIVANKVQMVT